MYITFEYKISNSEASIFFYKKNCNEEFFFEDYMQSAFSPNIQLI